MVGSGAMLKAVIMSMQPNEKVLKDWEGERETEFPKV